MPIVCQLCHQSFEKIISGTHLKFSHNITSAQYKTQFGNHSLASDEYRMSRSVANSGQNNPNFGNRLSSETRRIMSGKLKGRVPHNKNKKVTDPLALAKIQESIVKREQKYKEQNYHPRKGAVLSQDTRNKIRSSIKCYAENNPEIMRSRSAKAVITKKTNGYYDQKRAKSLEKIQKTWTDFGYQTIDVIDNQISLKHEQCGNLYQRILQSEINPRLCKSCFPVMSTSSAEIELKNYITDILGLEVIVGSRSILDNGFELDLVIPSLRIAIEYNGLYWHSESAGKSKWYHVTKMKKCLEKGYRLIQIFEDEWVNNQTTVKKRLHYILLNKNQTRIFARKTKIAQISTQESRSFCEQHHIQGAGNGHISYGLFVDNNLVAVMEFGHLSKAKGSTTQQGSYELTRFCSQGQIIGGASKLFKKFVEHHTPTQIISYSDLRWNTGNLYKQLHFDHVGDTLPNYWYVMGQKRYHRFKFRKDQLVKQGYDSNKTEREIMLELGYHVIWDCGHGKWIWNKKEE